MNGVLYSLAAFIVAIGVLVTVHEFGHFFEVLEIGFLAALNVPYVSAPFRICIVSLLEPEARHERLNNL